MSEYLESIVEILTQIERQEAAALACAAEAVADVICRDGRWRRLVPDELDRLQGFPAGWTDTGMTDGNRAFCMGNALVVGVVHRIGKAIVSQL